MKDPTPQPATCPDCGATDLDDVNAMDFDGVVSVCCFVCGYHGTKASGDDAVVKTYGKRSQ